MYLQLRNKVTYVLIFLIKRNEDSLFQSRLLPREYVVVRQCVVSLTCTAYEPRAYRRPSFEHDESEVIKDVCTKIETGKWRSFKGYKDDWEPRSRPNDDNSLGEPVFQWHVVQQLTNAANWSISGNWHRCLRAACGSPTALDNRHRYSWTATIYDLASTIFLTVRARANGGPFEFVWLSCRNYSELFVLDFFFFFNSLITRERNWTDSPMDRNLYKRKSPKLNNRNFESAIGYRWSIIPSQVYIHGDIYVDKFPEESKREQIRSYINATHDTIKFPSGFNYGTRLERGHSQLFALPR